MNSLHVYSVSLKAWFLCAALSESDESAEVNDLELMPRPPSALVIPVACDPLACRVRGAMQNFDCNSFRNFAVDRIYRKKFMAKFSW